MRRLQLLFGMVVVLGVAPAMMYADVWDYMLNVNGTTTCENQGGVAGSGFAGESPSPCTNVLAAGQTLSNVTGVSSTIDEGSGPGTGGSGTGTTTVTFNPGAAGNYYVNLLLFEELADPSYPTDPDLYGDLDYAVTSGTLATGESYQVDTPDYDYYSPGYPNPAAVGTIGANTAADTLDGTDHVPGPGAAPCAGTVFTTPCVDWTSVALGFNFTIGANQEEVLSFTASSTAPTSGFYIEQEDSNGDAPIYYSATATPESTVAGVPEPGSLVLLVIMLGILSFAFRSRIAAAKAK